MEGNSEAPGLLSTMWTQVTWSEVSGSLGDLGTFLPFAVGLASQIGLDLGTTLLFTGFYNICSGLSFRCPLCVQPMHTISGVALAAAGGPHPLTVPQVMSAGIFVSSVVLFLGLTGLAELFSWLVPSPVIRGVQLGVGMGVAIKGLDMSLRHKVHDVVVWRELGGSEGLLLGAAGLAFLLVTTMAPKIAGYIDWQPVPRDTVFEPIIRSLSSLSRIGSAALPATTAGVGSAGPAPAQVGTSPVPTSEVRDSGEDLDPEQDVASGGRSGAARRRLDPAAEQQQQGEDAPLLGVHREQQQQQQQQQAGGEQDGPAAAAAAAPSDKHGPFAAASMGCCVVVESEALERKLAGVSAERQGGAAASKAGKPAMIPSALLVVLLGLVLSVVRNPLGLSALQLGPSIPVANVPSWADFQTGILQMGLPQLPLTVLNSVVAAADLARQLFPERDPHNFRPGLFALSVGMMNLVGCWLGAMPSCHGSGGMAAQYKFGARHGAAPVLLGLVKVTLGLLLGSSLLVLLQSFPAPLLGALLALAGVELACSARAETTARGYTLVLLTAGSIIAVGTGPGFLIGWLAAATVALSGVASGPAWQALVRCWAGQQRV